MAFRGVLPAAPQRPSFGTELARGLGAGFGEGISRTTDLAEKFAIEKYKTLQRNKLISSIEGGSSGIGGSTVGSAVSPEDEIARKLQGASIEDPFRKAKLYAAAGEDQLARLETERAKIAEKKSMAQEEREFLPKKEYIQHSAKENTDYLNEVSQIEKDRPTTEFALGMMEDSLGDAGKWNAAKDWLADHTGFKGFRSAAGTELDSAIKQYFLGDLTSIKGGRANQFLEKQIRDAYPSAGQDPIANQKILLGMRLKEKINSLKIDKTRELEDKYIEKQGYLPSNFKSEVNKNLKSDAEKIEKDAINTLHNISKIQESRDKIFRAYLNPGETLMMDPEGNPFAVKNSEVPLYRNQGYIPMGKK